MHDNGWERSGSNMLLVNCFKLPPCPVRYSLPPTHFLLVSKYRTNYVENISKSQNQQ